jgi:Domain of unknown function (DUF4326)
MNADQLGFPFLPKLRAGTKLTETALELPEKLTFEQWKEIGRGLGRMERSTQWWIGDWWVFEKFEDGERKEVVNSEAWDGPSFQACMDNGSVCRKFDTSRRREVLSFEHHREVLSLPIDEADRLLDWCEEPLRNGENRPRTRSELREQVKKVKAYLAQGWNSSQLERKTQAERGEIVLANMTSDEKGIPIDNALITWAESQDLAMRIDRQSDWGNPYEVDADGTRDEVIGWYKEYFAHKRSLHKKRRDFYKKKVLLCWCYPEPCHGDFLIKQLHAD